MRIERNECSFMTAVLLFTGALICSQIAGISYKTFSNISKGYKDAPALRFNDKKTAVQFKIGQRVYDKDAPNKHRYINFAVKAFSPLS